MTVVLQATTRDLRGKKLRKLRAEGSIPAVLYGPKEATVAIALDASEFEKVFKEAGESTIIDLKGVGDDDKEVLVHDVAYDPITGTPLHVDFYAIERGKKLNVDVPLLFEGEAPAAKIGGALTKVLHEVEVESLPRHLPQHIVVDVSSLAELGSHIQIKDLVLPEGVEVLAEPEDVVVTITEVKEEVEEVPEAVDMDAIEVEQKGKAEEEGTTTEVKAGEESNKEENK